MGGENAEWLARLLESFEMYFCPRLTISDSPFEDELTVMVESDFRQTAGRRLRCASCSASVHFVCCYAGGDTSCGEYLDRDLEKLGSGESAMDKVWLNSTHFSGNIRNE